MIPAIHLLFPDLHNYLLILEGFQEILHQYPSDGSLLHCFLVSRLTISCFSIWRVSGSAYRNLLRTYMKKSFNSPTGGLTLSRFVNGFKISLLSPKSLVQNEIWVLVLKYYDNKNTWPKGNLDNICTLPKIQPLSFVFTENHTLNLLVRCVHELY